MKKKIFSLRLIVLMFFLLIPAAVSAQSKAAQAAANKSWQSFWTQFSAAVNAKNKAAVKRLMASENDFFSGGGGESRDEWLQLVESQKWWGLLQKSVRLGTRVDNSDRWLGRVTRDSHLTFAFIGGRWRFTGPMGD
jgi:hypothetical protein